MAKKDPLRRFTATKDDTSMGKMSKEGKKNLDELKKSLGISKKKKK